MRITLILIGMLLPLSAQAAGYITPEEVILRQQQEYFDSGSDQQLEAPPPASAAKASSSRSKRSAAAVSSAPASDTGGPVIEPTDDPGTEPEEEDIDPVTIDPDVAPTLDPATLRLLRRIERAGESHGAAPEAPTPTSEDLLPSRGGSLAGAGPSALVIGIAGIGAFIWIGRASKKPRKS